MPGQVGQTFCHARVEHSAELTDSVHIAADRLGFEQLMPCLVQIVKHCSDAVTVWHTRHSSHIVGGNFAVVDPMSLQGPVPGHGAGRASVPKSAVEVEDEGKAWGLGA